MVDAKILGSLIILSNDCVINIATINTMTSIQEVPDHAMETVNEATGKYYKYSFGIKMNYEPTFIAGDTIDELQVLKTHIMNEIQRINRAKIES